MADEHRYSVRAFHPPLKLIEVPEATPELISEALARSFGLFWSDQQSCAGALRVAIEGLAEHLARIMHDARRFCTSVEQACASIRSLDRL